MKFPKFLFAGLVFLGWSGSAIAQNEVDALRYSRYDIGGTSRVLGIGGASTALGADMSNFTSNPAGLGMFRHSEANFSLGLSFMDTESKVGEFTTSDNRGNLNVPSFGVVFTDRKHEDDLSDWRSGSLGIGFTRLNNFQNRITYDFLSSETSPTIVDYFGELAYYNQRSQASLDFEYGNNADNITSLEGLAYATYLLNIHTDTTTNEDFFTVADRYGRIRQTEEILTRGGQNQWDIAYGASFRDKLYIGGSLGIMTLTYKEERTYSEIESDTVSDFMRLDMTDELRTSGGGINLRVGLIYKPSDVVRFGASIQTPTFMSLTDKYQTRLRADYEGASTYAANTIPGEYDYHLILPFRANAGVALFAGKYGFLTADVEYVNYKSARFRAATQDDGTSFPEDRAYYRAQNEVIKNTYQDAVNFKIGAEGRLDIFRVRAGYAHSADPYSTGTFDRAKQFITLGAGMRVNRYYFDLAFVNSSYKSLYSPYTLSTGEQPVVQTENKANHITFTAGVNF